MPKILEKAVKEMQAKGMSKDKAYAIAKSSLEKAGDLNSKGQATPKGVKRGNMTHVARVKDRAKNGPVGKRKK